MTEMKIEYSPLSEVLKWPRNPRKHDPESMDASIKRFGFNDPPTIDEGTGHLVEGHGRVEALERRKKSGVAPPLRVLTREDGEWMIPIVRGVKFKNELEAEAYVVAHNRIGEGLWDNVALAEILEAQREVSLDGLGFSNSGEVDKIIGRYSPKGEVQEGDDVVPEPPKVATVKPGELWVLGNHRLICGDSTHEATVSQLFNAEKAALFATDPPYGVAYNVETGSSDKYEAIANDESDGPRLQAFLENVFRVAIQHLDPNAAWYLWHAQLTQGFFAAAAAAAAAADVLIHRQIIWVKPSLVLGHGDYHWRHELCFYGWRKGNRAKWLGDRSQTTVWEVGRENDHIHPTQKPVELFLRPYRFHTMPGDIGYEPFAGSGSQIIAAERAERRCFSVELDPRYCDVIIERWQRITGGKAVRG